jgi:hypothetical protein
LGGKEVKKFNMSTWCGSLAIVGKARPPLGKTYIETTIITNYRRSFRMEPEREEYKGHRIELRPREEVRAREAERADDLELHDLELYIDEQPVRYRQMPDGSYALEEYAYDWQDDLMDLARRFIDYRERAEEIRREAESGEET